MVFQPTAGRPRKQLFLNFKGGTGKTTLSAAYGLELARAGIRVLFVDLDPQGHLTRCVGVSEWQFDKTLYHALVRDVPIPEIMKRLPGVEASIIPADVSLSTTDLSLSGLPYREWRLVHALSSVKSNFDVIVFDAAPTISLVNLNAILACQDLIVPILPEPLSIHGLRTLHKTLHSIEVDFGHQIENIVVLLNRFVPDDPGHRTTRKHLQSAYKDHLLRTVVRYNADLSRQPLLNRFGSRLALDGEALADIRALIRGIGPEEDKKTARKRGK
jgi:chromosome partitioning protein